MDIQSSLNPISLPYRCHPIAKSPVSTPSPVLDSDMRLFAYVLAGKSRTNIEREARKAEPWLRKLVGHASLFDQVNHFIINHAESKAEEADEAEDPDEVESLG